MNDCGFSLFGLSHTLRCIVRKVRLALAENEGVAVS